MGIGAVCHTLNPRLFAEDLEYIINHAQARAQRCSCVAQGALTSSTGMADLLLVVGQVALKVSHGLQDYIILADFAFISLLEELRSKLSTVKYFIITTDEGHMPVSTPGGAWLCYDTLVRGPLCGKP